MADVKHTQKPEVVAYSQAGKGNLGVYVQPCQDKNHPVALVTAEDAEKYATAAYAEGRADERTDLEPKLAAGQLIDSWVVAHCKPIPWAKAVEIVAVVNKLSTEERDRLLALDARATEGGV